VDRGWPSSAHPLLYFFRDVMKETNKEYPEGHFVRLWIAISIIIFSGLGLPLSLVSGNPGLLGIGPAIGVSFGLAVGSAIEAKYKKEGKIRPLTEKEKNRKKIAVTSGLIILLIGASVWLLFFLKLL
jgi:uncharacterized membrane protein